MCNLSLGLIEQGVEQGRKTERMDTLIKFLSRGGSDEQAKELIDATDAEIIAAKRKANIQK